MLRAGCRIRVVCQSGERVVARLERLRVPESPLLRSAAEHDHGADDLPGTVADRCGRIVDGNIRIIAADRRAVLA